MPLDVLTALSRADGPLCSRDLLELVVSAQSGTDVCRVLYDLRKSGFIQEVGSVPSTSKMGKALRTYGLTPAGRDQIAPAGSAAEPDASPADSPCPAPGDRHLARRDTGRPWPYQVPAPQWLAVPEPEPEPEPVAKAPAADSVMQAIAGLGRPAPRVSAVDIERLVALADTEVCHGAVGDWLHDLAVRLAHEVQP
jgi:hypothetical protein